MNHKAAIESTKMDKLKLSFYIEMKRDGYPHCKAWNNLHEESYSQCLRWNSRECEMLIVAEDICKIKSSSLISCGKKISSVFATKP